MAGDFPGLLDMGFIWLAVRDPQLSGNCALLKSLRILSCQKPNSVFFLALEGQGYLLN